MSANSLLKTVESMPDYVTSYQFAKIIGIKQQTLTAWYHKWNLPRFEGANGTKMIDKFSFLVWCDTYGPAMGLKAVPRKIALARREREAAALRSMRK